LELKGVARRAVEEWRDGEVQLAFQVTLLVVLLHFVGEPFEIDDGQLAGVAVVRRIQTHIQNQLLVFVVVFWEFL